jgi:hypothetical protein
VSRKDLAVEEAFILRKNGKEIPRNGWNVGGWIQLPGRLR